jgi:hypothetical protein
MPLNGAEFYLLTAFWTGVVHKEIQRHSGSFRTPLEWWSAQSENSRLYKSAHFAWGPGAGVKRADFPISAAQKSNRHLLRAKQGTEGRLLIARESRRAKRSGRRAQPFGPHGVTGAGKLRQTLPVCHVPSPPCGRTFLGLPPSERRRGALSSRCRNPVAHLPDCRCRARRGQFLLSCAFSGFFLFV